jgi:hypothetical protein
VTADDYDSIELSLLVSRRQDLVEDQTRAINRMLDLLCSVHPGPSSPWPAAASTSSTPSCAPGNPTNHDPPLSQLLDSHIRLRSDLAAIRSCRRRRSSLLAPTFAE